MESSFWHTDPVEADTYALFRGSFIVERSSVVEIRVTGSSWYQAWLDREPLLEGPYRYALDFPEYQVLKISLEAGEHMLAFHCHHIGVETRILKDTEPYLWCQICVDSAMIPISWKALPLNSQASETHRINPQLGWIEWRDTRLEPVDWELKDFDDSDWGLLRWGASSLAAPVEAKLAVVKTFTHTLKKVSEGALATTFGYRTDEPAYIFYSRDRECLEYPAKGCWRRYDLGRIRLGRACITLDVPAGTEVQFAYSERLTEGRVSPYINLSAGKSCNLDHYIARGGVQEFCSITPKGGRFVEIHILTESEEIRFIKEEYLERGYHAPSEAKFECGDALIERIWQVGIETLRSCAEDALIDNPTRERGQWVGDVAAVGMDIESIAYHDLRLSRRALVQAAQCAREDGLVAGMSPGGCEYLATYAFQWPVAVMKYYRYTGDASLLDELWSSAEKNMQAILAFWNDDGLHHVAGWNFIDWGYETESGPVDLACNLHFYWSLQAMVEWAGHVEADAGFYREVLGQVESLVVQLLENRRAMDGWSSVGYHCTALALSLKLIEEDLVADGLAYLAAHIRSCFPNNPDGPRNDDPQAVNSQLITPYFGHYVLPLFIENGEMDFALEQYRKCWGWMLQGDETTWVEVFDKRWSHAHQWSGCPTWQLSRYVLGLHLQLDKGDACFKLCLRVGSLKQANGQVPHPLGGWIQVKWSRDLDVIHYDISVENPVELAFSDGTRRVVERSERLIFDSDGVELCPN